MWANMTRSVSKFLINIKIENILHITRNNYYSNKVNGLVLTLSMALDQ